MQKQKQLLHNQQSVPLPTINYKGSSGLSKFQKAVNLFLMKCWLYCSYEMAPAELPAGVFDQLHHICLLEERSINQVTLVRTAWNHFEIRENGVRTYWCFFIHTLQID
jgi:hypothetical protein